MATITIEDIPPDLHAVLIREAAAHQRSLKQEILARLRDSVVPEPRDPVAILAEVDRVRHSDQARITSYEEVRQAIEEGRE